MSGGIFFAGINYRTIRRQVDFLVFDWNSNLHKMAKNVEYRKQIICGKQKVIHISTNDFIGKNELYTEWFTLSTEIVTNFAVYIVKNSNNCFVQKQ